MNEIISFMANPKADIESGDLDDETLLSPRHA